MELKDKSILLQLAELKQNARQATNGVSRHGDLVIGGKDVEVGPRINIPSRFETIVSQVTHAVRHILIEVGNILVLEVFQGDVISLSVQRLEMPRASVNSESSVDHDD